MKLPHIQTERLNLMLQSPEEAGTDRRDEPNRPDAALS